MMIVRRPFGLVLLVSALSAVPLAAQTAVPAEAAVGAQAAALSWTFENVRDRAAPSVFCVAADSAVLSRLRPRSATVKPVSSCAFERNPIQAWTDRTSGMPALHFSAGVAEWLKPEAAVVEVDVSQGTRSGTLWRCVVEQAEGTWRVRACRPVRQA